MSLRRGWLAGGLLLIAAGLALDAGWIHGKAWLAQQLLRAAWAEHRQDGRQNAPWPGADTHPVAVLRVPHLAVEQVVLAGDSGRILAFGPGWAPASAAPEGPGTVVLSGHRDTHFAWLRALQVGDRVELETRRGLRRWRVIGGRVADSRYQQLALDPYGERLLLVTCWPFDAVAAGGPLRWVLELAPAAF